MEPAAVVTDGTAWAWRHCPAMAPPAEGGNSAEFGGAMFGQSAEYDGHGRLFGTEG
jgi:hypothetical protein